MIELINPEGRWRSITIRLLNEKFREGVSGTYSRKAHVWMPFLLLLVILSACSRQLNYPEAPSIGEDISIPVSALQSGVPQYYVHSLNGTKIRFFVMKMDHRMTAFLDACTKCYPQKKGFAYASGSVICRACNERYPVSEIEHGFGSCYPIKLQGRIKEDRYLISAAELETLGAKYFR